jgi:YD repeat-containing protein
MTTKNLRIKQDGTVRTFNDVSVIGTRTDIVSGDWIPEEDARTTWKHIDKNGQYKARERDGVAGYTAVFVHVPLNKITGIDPTDGKTYEVKLDAQGNLTRRLVEE